MKMYVDCRVEVPLPLQGMVLEGLHLQVLRQGVKSSFIWLASMSKGGNQEGNDVSQFLSKADIKGDFQGGKIRKSRLFREARVQDMATTGEKR